MKAVDLLLVCALSGCLAASCSVEASPDNGFFDTETGNPACQEGMVRVKVTEDFASILESGVNDDVATRAMEADEVLASMGIVRMERTFPYAGEFEERTRREGLHLWYDVWYDADKPATRAGDLLSGVEGVQLVEFIPRIGKLDDVEPCDLPATRSDAGYFNDPYLPGYQWHYYNDGSTPNSIAGADINVVPVWKEYTTGNENVIVCVTDGGVDLNHEDLALNAWTGKAEDGTEIHGYNFVDDSYDIVPTFHGTHVAGTVAAVNNNGIGVCGVAGGDYAKGIPGVKIMSCQILADGEDVQGSGAAAIKWGADHGAVISQNSWGYSKGMGLTDTPQSDKDAIDYFIKYAGMDASGKQVGPMAGGIVIFAGGNNGSSKGAYPALYESCVAVSAISSDFSAPTYTNYGDWVDVIAPGGDQIRGVYVYSTIPGNKYGRSQGTSMACPHVSGVAALLVSRFGGPGFTSETLRKMIEKSLTDISGYNPYMKLGKGLLNAYAAFSVKVENAVPEVVGNIEDQLFNSMEAREIALGELFSDADGDALSYEVVSSDTKVLEASRAGETLTLTPRAKGLAVVTVTVDDGNEGTASLSFKVLVRDSGAAADVYPNPATEYVNVRTAEPGKYTVAVTNVSGLEVYGGESDMDAFHPLRIDLGSFAPGYYTLELAKDGARVFKGGFVKR